VTVQREDEKLLMKQLRKEDKKMRAAMKNVESDSDDEQFDPERMRAARIAQLSVAQKKPILGPRKVVVPNRPAWMELPNVYDSQNDARQTAGNKLKNRF
jgi:hypothetical protein